ncbi:MAG: hypothetical protein ACXWDI_03825, partial [Nocardioides sp.]
MLDPFDVELAEAPNPTEEVVTHQVGDGPPLVTFDPAQLDGQLLRCGQPLLRDHRQEQRCLPVR